MEVNYVQEYIYIWFFKVLYTLKPSLQYWFYHVWSDRDLTIVFISYRSQWPPWFHWWSTNQGIWNGLQRVSYVAIGEGYWLKWEGGDGEFPKINSVLNICKSEPSLQICKQLCQTLFKFGDNYCKMHSFDLKHTCENLGKDYLNKAKT